MIRVERRTVVDTLEVNKEVTRTVTTYALTAQFYLLLIGIGIGWLLARWIIL